MLYRTIIATYLPLTFTTVCLLFTTWSMLFLIPAFLGICDAKARHTDFLEAMDRVTVKQVKRLRHSACQRNAAIAALGNYARRIYINMGYRWYHVLPDGTFTVRNNPYLKVNFYKRLLGV